MWNTDSSLIKKLPSKVNHFIWFSIQSTIFFIFLINPLFLFLEFFFLLFFLKITLCNKNLLLFDPKPFVHLLLLPLLSSFMIFSSFFNYLLHFVNILRSRSFIGFRRMFLWFLNRLSFFCLFDFIIYFIVLVDWRIYLLFWHFLNYKSQYKIIANIQNNRTLWSR